MIGELDNSDFSIGIYARDPEFPLAHLISIRRVQPVVTAELLRHFLFSIHPMCQCAWHNMDLLGEAMRPEFKAYGAQVVRNARTLGEGLQKYGLKLVTGGTDNHMLLLDLTPSGPARGVFLQEALDRVGITVNKNTIPGEPSSPFYPSGIRLGTPAATTRGMREPEMERLAAWIAAVAERIQAFQLPADRKARLQTINEFRAAIENGTELARIREEVRAFCVRFPLPGI